MMTEDDVHPSPAAELLPRETAFAVGVSELPSDEPASQGENDKAKWNVFSQERSARTYGGPLTIFDVKDSFRRGCSYQAWRRRLPVSTWIAQYSLKDLKGDMIAGITVGLTVIPQALAYSQIAELPLKYGLYSSFMGCFMYAFLGTSKDVTLGATAILSLLTAESYPKDADIYKPQYAIFLCFFTGIFQLLMGVLNLGFIINFISTPVISGFTTASAFIIMYGQLKSVLGLSFGKSTDGVIEQTHGYIANMWKVNGWDILLGVSCVAVLLILKELPSLRQKMSGPKLYYCKSLVQLLRLLSIARYGIVVIVAAVVGFLLEQYYPGGHSLTLTKDVQPGLPPFQLPVFSFNNQTFPDIFHDMSSGILVVSLVGAMESVAIAKAFAHQFQYNISPTQEFLALGVANFMSSFVSSYPVTGSFTKSSLNAQSGVRTPMGCAFTGMFVLAAITLLSSSFRFVPRSALGAVIICAVSAMFEFKIFKDLWLLNKKELLPLTATITVSLFYGVDSGILVGIVTALILLLYPLARPAIDVESVRTVCTLAPQNAALGRRICEVRVTPQGSLYFPSVEYIKEFFDNDVIHSDEFTAWRANKFNFEHEKKDVAEAINPLLVPDEIRFIEAEDIVVFNGVHLVSSDYTTLRGLRSIVMKCKKASKTLRFINTPQSVLKIILPKDLREQVVLNGSGDGEMVTMQFSRSVPEKMAELEIVGGESGAKVTSVS